MIHRISARRAIASFFGAYAGFLGVEHGLFEAAQGNAPTNGLLINAIAPNAGNMWLGGEPAVTVLPTFLLAGISAMLLGLAVAVWSVIFIDRKYGAAVLAVLLAGQLLVGGGLAPLFVGMWAVIVGFTLGSPQEWWRTRVSSGVQRLLAKLLPFAFLVFLLLSSVDLAVAVFGYNPSLLNVLAPFLVLALPLTMVLGGLASDFKQANKEVM